MMFYDVLWCSMMFYDVLWCSMMFFDVLWCSMMFYDVQWCSLMFYDVLWYFMTWPNQQKDKPKTMKKTTLEFCDIWDTDYNYDNWYPEFMTIFVTWELRMTLDSICNSCDVLLTMGNTCWYLLWLGFLMFNRKDRNVMV